jgi:4-aminobutyrate aminotransferase/(S)-3-amino-2-methylpropionate transaminase
MAMTKVIEIRTEIPGPRSRALLERERMAIAHPLIVHLPIFAERAENATITDVDGNVFVDFAGGVGVVNSGHAHPRIVEAVAEQAARFLHTDFTVVPYPAAIELAERLCALAPISGEKRAAFFNAGTEAVENAVKLARLERMLDTYLPAEHVAAIVIEPQLGEGGFVPASTEYMQGLRALCDRTGIVLVADEVQTGFGRTGRMFAMEHFGVEPDLMTVAKSIAAGLPLSGVIGRAEIMDGPHAGAIGGTYIGNPVAQAAALAVLDVFEEESLLERACLVGDRIREQMLSWQARWPAIGDVRGLGAMLAIELVEDPGSKEPAPEVAKAVIDAALERGLILLKAGTYGNCIRVLCPLTIEDAVLDEALAVWEESLAAVLG